MITCRFGVCGQRVARWSSQPCRARWVRSPRRCGCPARVMRRWGRSSSWRVSPGPGGLDGGQRDDQALIGGARGSLDGADLLLGQGQQVRVGLGSGDPGGGVGEHQPVPAGEPEQRTQRGQRGAPPGAAQPVEFGGDIGAGDLAQVPAGDRPALQQRPGGPEVDVDARGLGPAGVELGVGPERPAAGVSPTASADVADGVVGAGTWSGSATSSSSTGQPSTAQITSSSSSLMTLGCRTTARTSSRR